MTIWWNTHLQRKPSYDAGGTFVRDILLGQMNAKAIVVGTDCSFGYNRLGNAGLLEQMSKEYDFKLWGD